MKISTDLMFFLPIVKIRSGSIFLRGGQFRPRSGKDPHNPNPGQDQVKWHYITIWLYLQTNLNLHSSLISYKKHRVDE